MASLFDIHGAIRLDKVASGKRGNLETLMYTADCDNGSIFHVGDLVTGEREVKQAVVPTTASIATESIVIVTEPESTTTYWAGQTYVNHYNRANTPMRANPLTVGDVITITNLALVGTPVVDSYVAPADGSNKFNVVGTTEPTTRCYGKIIELDTIYGQPAAVVEIKHV